MDIKKIEQILQLFEKSSVASMELEVDDIKIKLEKARVATEAQPSKPHLVHSTTSVSEPQVEEVVGTWVKAPLVGTYYQSGSPDKEAYVSVGDTVKKGDTLCLLEAMKVMNEIKAPCDGVVLEIRASNSMMVGYDQPLMLLGEVA